MNGLAFVGASAVAVLFIWTPLCFFGWFGLSSEVMAFHQGERLTAVCFIVLFYVMNSYLIFRTVKATSKWPWATLAYGMWGLGFLRFVMFFNSFSK